MTNKYDKVTFLRESSLVYLQFNFPWCDNPVKKLLLHQSVEGPSSKWSSDSSLLLTTFPSSYSSSSLFVETWRGHIIVIIWMCPSHHITSYVKSQPTFRESKDRQTGSWTRHVCRGRDPWKRSMKKIHEKDPRQRFMTEQFEIKVCWYESLPSSRQFCGAGNCFKVFRDHLFLPPPSRNMEII